MTILTAKIADVKFGNLVFEGLMFPDTTYGIAVPQICSMFSFTITHASRDIKTLLGKDFQFTKARTTLNSKAVNVLQLNDFEKLLRKLDRKGNKQAQSITDDLIGLSLQQLFSDAFNQKFEKEERQNWMLQRQSTKDLFFDIMNQTHVWYEATKEERSQPFEKYCINVSNCINTGLFGKKSKEIRTELQIGDAPLIRDYFNPEALRRVAQIESIATNKLKLDSKLRPVDAVKFALEVSNFETLTNYKNTGDN